ncbi:hypothetical protein LCGC14_3111820, partial [marine sediment metagenome]
LRPLILEQFDRQLRIGPHIEARFFGALPGGRPTSEVIHAQQSPKETFYPG